ncbi:hypothetical protein Tco_0797725 [Tanacetum coccineum]
MRLDESFSSRNHVRKFLKYLPTKWRPKVTAIKESKDLSTLPLEKLIGNLKVFEVVLEKDLEISKSKKEKYKSLALKARKVLSEEEATSSDSDDEEYAMAVGDFKKFFRRRGKFVRQPYDDKKNFRKVKKPKRRRMVEDVLSVVIQITSLVIVLNTPSMIKRHSLSNVEATVESKKEEICLIALDNNEVLSDTPYYSSSSLDNESWENEPAEADWAICGPFFNTFMLGDKMPCCFVDGVTYGVPWFSESVEKVYFLINAEDNHWVLAEFHNHFDKLPKLLIQSEVMEKKNIDPSNYSISYRLLNNLPSKVGLDFLPWSREKSLDLPIHRSGYFTSPPVRRYTNAVVDWYDFVDSELFSINEYDSLLEDLGFKDGRILFTHFLIPGKSLDEGFAPLMSDEDVFISLAKEKGVLIEEIVEDDNVEGTPI